MTRRAPASRRSEARAIATAVPRRPAGSRRGRCARSRRAPARGRSGRTGPSSTSGWACASQRPRVRYETTVSGGPRHRVPGVPSRSGELEPRLSDAFDPATRPPVSRPPSAFFLTILAMLAVLVAKIVLRDVPVAAGGRLRRDRLRPGAAVRAERPAADALRLRHGELPRELPDEPGRLRRSSARSRRAPASRSWWPRPSRSTGSASRACSR